jgi:hypothetical protein
MDERQAQSNEEQTQSKKSKLAYVIARGGCVAAWASKNDVSRRTAFYWAKELKVCQEVEEIRRRSFNQALGRMNSRARKAADGILNLAESSESDAVRLRAWRSILTDQMEIARFSTLDLRMRWLEDSAMAQKGKANGPRCYTPAP